MKGQIELGAHGCKDNACSQAVLLLLIITWPDADSLFGKI